AVKTLEEYHGYKMLCTHHGLTESIIEQAFKIIKTYPVSFYDASYHALALVTKGTFVTLDEKYYQKTKGLKHVIPLGEY
ncbi:MAG: type II toxin-antitoxin system VapC family toxin, partial [Candidatus Gracilibacteria bacterium]|nr:type II toxin-antitoxin system VapC family toxin [Candidatus Gracilibacteria bacterium]